jgi:hypothetical protein
MAGDVHNHVVAPGHDCCLVSHCAPVPLRGVGVRIKCECSRQPSGAFVLSSWHRLGRDRRSDGDFGRGGDLPEMGDPRGEALG